jgi:hypothetical protein
MITDQTEVYRKKMLKELQEIEEQLQHLNPVAKQG